MSVRQSVSPPDHLSPFSFTRNQSSLCLPDNQSFYHHLLAAVVGYRVYRAVIVKSFPFRTIRFVFRV